MVGGEAQNKSVAYDDYSVTTPALSPGRFISTLINNEITSAETVSRI